LSSDNYRLYFTKAEYLFLDLRKAEPAKQAGSLLSLLILLFLPACAASFPQAPSGRAVRLIENVPFYPQEIFQCGPASLAAVFNHWGTKVSPEEIGAEIFSQSARGTLTMDMVLYAEGKGFSVRQYKGDLAGLHRNIDSGFPLIVMVDYGFSIYEKNHFMVILGYNEEGLWVHSGREREKFIPLKDFLPTWEKTGSWTLLITPP
jgi:hypothetical protein